MNDLTVKLTREEFRTIYNAKCSVYGIIQNLERVLSETMLNQLRRVCEGLESGTSRVMGELDAEDDKRREHYETVAEEYGYMSSIWSMYEVTNLYDKHPYKAVHLVYQDSVYDISWCKTWVKLWAVADRAINIANDDHIFIEGFSVQDGGCVLKLHTGS